LPFLETGPFWGSLVFLDHSAALYRYSPALERYAMWDNRFNDFTTCLDLQTFVGIFSENFDRALQSGMPLISLPFSPLMAKVLQTCLHKYFAAYIDNWLCVSFFHDNEDTAKIPPEHCENPVAYKAAVQKGLLDFPYIKKITIPYNLLLTYPVICNLVESVL
jgi:hypothetical protein